eukprot:GHRQ01024930.1.p2 GENE.GHRQ01024930.1~~GHRQ01024930.1.p2  ORF type:complete len:135 (-),score=53.26 GHRQ01024930.1:203-607(-)
MHPFNHVCRGPHHARQAFLEGFWQLVPRELVCIFNDHELELLLSGLPDIELADLRANTEYTGFSPNSPVIQWFWQLVADMDKQDLALLLQFVTGERARPAEGVLLVMLCAACGSSAWRLLSLTTLVVATRHHAT